MAQRGNITALVEGWEVEILKEIYMGKIPRLEDHTTCQSLRVLKPFVQGGIQCMKSGTAIFEDRTNKSKTEGATDVGRS